MKGKCIPEIPGENVSYPGKKYPDPDRPEIKFPDPTRPENILKTVPRPRTGFGPVRSGKTRGFGLPRRSLILIIKNYLPVLCMPSGCIGNSEVQILEKMAAQSEISASKQIDYLWR